MHNQIITSKRVKPKEQIKEPENKRIILAPSISTTFFWDTDTINITFSHLFGRGSEHYLGRTQLSDLRSLMAFGVCSSYANKLVCEYAKKLAAEFQKDVLFFNNECFKLEDPEDVIKAFMVKNLEDNKSYLIELSIKFQSKFSEFLANPLVAQPAQKALANNLGSLQSVLKTNQANVLLDAVLWEIFNILSDGDNIWPKKTLAIFLTGKICLLNGFAYTENQNQILIEIIKKTIDLLSHQQLQLVNSAMHFLGGLGQVRILKELPFETIEKMILNVENLLDHNDWQAVAYSLRIMGQSIAIFLQKLSFETKERIVVKVESILSHNHEQVKRNALGALGSLIQAGIYKDLPLQIKERIFFKLESFLNQNNEHIMQNALDVLGFLIRSEIFENFTLQIKERIFLKVESLLSHNDEQVKRNALGALGSLIRAGIYKNLPLQIRERIFLKLESFLSHTNEQIIQNVLDVIGSLIQTEILKELPIELTEKIIVKTKSLLDHKQELMFKKGLFIFSQLINAGIIKELPLEVTEKIIVKADNLLDPNQKSLANNDLIRQALTILGALARAGMIKGIPSELIESIIVKIENLLGHNHEYIVTSALLAIGYLLEAGMLNESSDLIEQISIKAEKLLGHNQWRVVINAIFVMLLINRTNPETILNKITESHVNIIHKGILVETNLPKTGNENLIKILTVLSKHESLAIQNMSLNLLSHIHSL